MCMHPHMCRDTCIYTHEGTHTPTCIHTCTHTLWHSCVWGPGSSSELTPASVLVRLWQVLALAYVSVFSSTKWQELSEVPQRMAQRHLETLTSAWRRAGAPEMPGITVLPRIWHPHPHIHSPIFVKLPGCAQWQCWSLCCLALSLMY